MTKLVANISGNNSDFKMATIQTFFIIIFITCIKFVLSMSSYTPQFFVSISIGPWNWCIFFLINETLKISWNLMSENPHTWLLAYCYKLGGHFSPPRKSSSQQKRATEWQNVMHYIIYQNVRVACKHFRPWKIRGSDTAECPCYTHCKPLVI